MRPQFRLRTLFTFVLAVALLSRPVANWRAATFRADCAKRCGLNDSVGWVDLVSPRDLSRFHKDGLALGPLASDADVAVLSSISGVSSVAVQSSRISNEAYETIARIENLKRIWIRQPAYVTVTDDSFKSLAEAGELEQLVVGGSVTDAALDQIGNLTSLRELVLIGTSITGEGLYHLSDLNQLERLFIYSDCLNVDYLSETVTTLPSSIRSAAILEARKDAWPKSNLSFEIKRIQPDELNYYLQHPNRISCYYAEETQLLKFMRTSTTHPPGSTYPFQN